MAVCIINRAPIVSRLLAAHDRSQELLVFEKGSEGIAMACGEMLSRGSSGVKKTKKSKETKEAKEGKEATYLPRTP